MRDRFDRWFRPSEYARREIDEEISAHLAARVDHLVNQGMTAEAARAEALRRFGDVDAARAALLSRARSRHRRLELRERLDRLRLDVRFVLRSLRRNPAFSLGVVLTLALGLGVNAAVFRVADQVLLRPPAGVRDVHTVRRVEATLTLSGMGPQRATAFSYPDASRLIASDAFAQVAIDTRPRVQHDGEGREIGLSYADERYFPMLGTAMARGRAFEAGEALPGSTPGVAIISFAYWRRVLGGRALDDRAFVTVASRQYRVIGVTEPGFTGIDLDPVDVWLPFGDANLGSGSVNGVPFPWYRSDMLRALRILGRAPPKQEETARQQLSAALAFPTSPFAPAQREASLQPIVPIGEGVLAGTNNQLLLRLSAVAAIVMVIACGNAMNLLLARSLRRAREIGIRFAVGASRLRVARLVVIESVLLALAGALAATLSALWTGDALRRLVFPDSRWSANAFDERTAIFTLAVAVTAGVVAGLVPALQSTRHGVVSALKEGRIPGGRAGRTRELLIVLQTALSLALLVGCGLLVRSLLLLNAVDLGFEPRGLIVVTAGRMNLNEPELVDLAERLRRTPDVSGLSLASIAPFGATAMIDITVPGASYVPESDRDNPLYAAVDANYFAVMGMRVLQGRSFGKGDVAGAEPVAVVNQSMARRYWGSASPFDSCIIAPPNPCARVVGVVSDVRDEPGRAAPMRFYLALPQSAAAGAAAIVMRTIPARLPDLTAAIRSAGGPSSRPTIDVIVERIGRALHPWRMATLLFAALGLLALALACLGIYSVTSYLVAERMHEMGIRLALGATGGMMVGLVLRRGLRLIVIGASTGLIAAAAVGQLLSALLFEVSAVEPTIYAAAAISLALLATFAMLPAAIRASHVDPIETLRAE